MEIKILTKHDLPELVRLASKLWPDSEHLENEFDKIIGNPNEIVFFIEGIGFAHYAIRHDYVNGSSTSPLVYLEGIYVEEAYRKQGFASLLIEQGETWGKKRGALEMGSDVLIENEKSMLFHEKVGFKEAERVVCYIKRIRSEKNE